MRTRGGRQGRCSPTAGRRAAPWPPAAARVGRRSQGAPGLPRPPARRLRRAPPRLRASGCCGGGRSAILQLPQLGPRRCLEQAARKLPAGLLGARPRVSVRVCGRAPAQDPDFSVRFDCGTWGNGEQTVTHNRLRARECVCAARAWWAEQPPCDICVRGCALRCGHVT